MAFGWVDLVLLPFTVLGMATAVALVRGYSDYKKAVKAEEAAQKQREVELREEQRRHAMYERLDDCLKDATDGVDLDHTIPGIGLVIEGEGLTSVAKSVFSRDLYNLREEDVVEGISATAKRSWRLGGLLFFCFAIRVRGSYVREFSRDVRDLVRDLWPFIDRGLRVRLHLDRPPFQYSYRRSFYPCCIDLTKWGRAHTNGTPVPSADGPIFRM
jgi:hypothetical protein